MSNIKKANNNVKRSYAKTNSKVRGANANIGLEGVLLSAMNFMDALNGTKPDNIHTKRSLTRQEEEELKPIDGNVVISYTKEELENKNSKNEQIKDNNNNICKDEILEKN